MPSHTATERVKAAIRRRLVKLDPRKRFKQGLKIPTYRDIRASPELRKFLEEGK